MSRAKQDPHSDEIGHWLVFMMGEIYGPYETEFGAHDAAKRLAGAHAGNSARVARISAVWRNNK